MLIGLIVVLFAYLILVLIVIGVLFSEEDFTPKYAKYETLFDILGTISLPGLWVALRLYTFLAKKKNML